MPKCFAVSSKVDPLLAALCIHTSFSFAQGKSAVAEDRPDQELKEFRLDDLKASLATMEPGPERDYFAEVLATETATSQAPFSC
jgi:hypothetical protein